MTIAVLTTKLNRLVAAEAAWRKAVAEPLIQRAGPSPTGRSPAHLGGHQQRRGARERHASRARLGAQQRPHRHPEHDHPGRGRARRRAARRAHPLLGPDQLDARSARPPGRGRQAPRGRGPAHARGGGRPSRDRDPGTCVQRDGQLARTRRPGARPGRADEGRLRAHRLARAAHAGDGGEGLRGDAHRPAQVAQLPPVRGRGGDRGERRTASEDDQRPARPGAQRRGQAPDRAGADARSPAGPANRPADAAQLREQGPALHGQRREGPARRSRRTPGGSARCSPTC